MVYVEESKLENYINSYYLSFLIRIRYFEKSSIQKMYQLILIKIQAHMANSTMNMNLLFPHQSCNKVNVKLQLSVWLLLQDLNIPIERIMNSNSLGTFLEKSEKTFTVILTVLKRECDRTVKGFHYSLKSIASWLKSSYPFTVHDLLHDRF